MMKTMLPALAHAVVFDRNYAADPVVSLEGIKSQLQVCIFCVQIICWDLGGLEFVHDLGEPIR